MGTIRKREPWEDTAEDYSIEYIKHCCCSGAGFVRLDRQRGEPLFGRPIPCICHREEAARQRAERLRARSGISQAEYRQWTFDAFDPQLCRPVETIPVMEGIKVKCLAYALHPEGWVILAGEPGTGKTHLAYAIAGECLKHGREVYAHTLPEMLAVLRTGFTDGTYDELMTDLRDVDVLVIDDLGAERPTDWTLERLYELVNHRYAKRLPMVVTTNSSLDPEQSTIDSRILSRLREGTRSQGDGWARVFTLPAQDFRPWRAGR